MPKGGKANGRWKQGRGAAPAPWQRTDNRFAALPQTTQQGHQPSKRKHTKKGGDRQQRGGNQHQNGGKRGGGMDPTTKSLLKLFLSTRWDKTARLLDLSQLKSAEAFTGIGWVPDLNTLSFCTKLCSVISEIYVPLHVQSLSFSDNGISTLLHLSKCLSSSDISIANLCLSNNKLSMLSELDNLKDLRLREVMLTGNPVATHVQYKQYSIKKLSSLELLDGDPIMGLRATLMPRLPPVVGGHCDDTNKLDMLGKFTQKFLAAVDQRQQESLLDAYDKNALFSFTVDTKMTLPNVPRANQLFSNLLRVSHNLQTAQGKARPTQGVRQGRLKTVEAMFRVVWPDPFTTTHSDFQVDLKSFGETLIATLHGKILLKAPATRNQQKAFQQTLCFDRTWILGGSSNSDWGLLIKNDMLHIRQDASHVMVPPTPPEVQQQQATATAPQPASSSNSSPSVDLSSLGEEDRQRLQAVQQGTNLKMDRCFELLKVTKGDVQAALQEFNQKKAMIPKDYFVG